MPLELGAVFTPRPAVVAEPEPPKVTVEDLRAEQLLTAIGALREALVEMPTPVVNVAEPDLTAIVQAVTQLKGPATADEIAAAVVSQITPGGEPGMESVLGEVVAALKKLDFRMQGGGLGSNSGAGVFAGSVDISDRDDRRLGRVSIGDPVKLAPGTAFLGYTGSYEDDASKQGRYRFAGGRATTSVVTPNASITLSNPAGSGVDLILNRYQVEVDAAADVVLVMDAVSTGTLMANLNPNFRTTVVNPGEVRIGSGVLTGGTVASVIRRAVPNSPVAVGPFRFRITPGRTFTVRFLGPGATNNVWFNCGWFVIPEGGDLA